VALILVLEDSPNQLARIASVLSAAGHTVREAEDWAQCRAALSEITPDLVLLDVNLAGMQGGDVLAMQLKRHPKLRSARVAFHSAAKEADLKVMVRRSGADGYIVKGADDQAFLKALNALLGQNKPA
jgi:DNA-binding response OmpR family regulator